MCWRRSAARRAWPGLATSRPLDHARRGFRQPAIRLYCPRPTRPNDQGLGMAQEGNSVSITTPAGKTASLPLLHGTAGASVIDIRKLYNETGYFTFDPGYTCTGSCDSKIPYIGD